MAKTPPARPRHLHRDLPRWRGWSKARPQGFHGHCGIATAQLARELSERDGQSDNEENHIEEGCLKVIALHQPVPSIFAGPRRS